MTKQNKKEYDTPMVELIEARVEKGFSGSGVVDEPQTRGTNETLTSSGESHNGYDFN